MAHMSKAGSQARMKETEIGQDLMSSDEAFSRLTPILPIFPGLHVMFWQNIANLLGIDNASLPKTPKTLWVQLSECTSPKQADLHTTLSKMCLWKSHRDYLKCYLWAYWHVRYSLMFRICYPKTTVPLVKFDTTLKTMAMNWKRLRIQLTQFPGAPCFAWATFKLQSATPDTLIIYLLREGVISHKPATYVLLSRITMYKWLFSMGKTTPEDYELFRPPDFVIDEEQRLFEKSRIALLKYFPGLKAPHTGSQGLQAQMPIGTHNMCN